MTTKINGFRLTHITQTHTHILLHEFISMHHMHFALNVKSLLLQIMSIYRNYNYNNTNIYPMPVNRIIIIMHTHENCIANVTFYCKKYTPKWVHLTTKCILCKKCRKCSK